MTGWERSVRHMAGQGGLALREEIRAFGVSERTISRRLGEGLLLKANPWVLALPGTELDHVALTRAAVMARPAAIPTGLSAAAFLGEGPWSEIPLVGEPWLVGVDGRGLSARVVRHPGMATVRRAGLVIADPAAAVIDLLRYLEADRAAGVGRAALQRRVVSINLLLGARARLGRLQGARQLGEITEVLLEGTHAESEHRLVELLREAGITGWHANHPVQIGRRLYFIDVAFPEIRLAIEADGRAHHSDAKAFQTDRRRQNDLVGASWTVLRFTWEDIVHRPEEVVARILGELSRASA